MGAIISEWSDVQTVSTTGEAPANPFAPMVLGFIVRSDTEIGVRITNGGNQAFFNECTTFEIEFEKSTDPFDNITWELVRDLDYPPAGGLATKEFTNLVPGTTYKCRARWVKDDGL